MTETSTPIDMLDDAHADNGEVAKWILPLIFPELNARTLQEKGSQHLLQDNVARLAGNLQAVTCNVAAFSEALQTQWRAIAALAKGQGQMTHDVRELQALIKSIVDAVTDVAREQAAVRGAMQDSAKVTTAATEALQQGQRALQTQVEKMADVAGQASAALTATAAEQTAVHETVKRVKEEVTGLGTKQAALNEAVQAHGQTMAAVTGGLASDIRRLQELTQTVVGSVAEVAREQAAVRGAMQDSTKVMNSIPETMQQSRSALQAELGKVADAARQTGAALAATTVAQTAVHETVKQMREEVTGIAAKQAAFSEAMQTHEQTMASATAALASGQGQLAGDVRRLQELTQTVAGSVADAAREQGAVRGLVQDSVKTMSATAEAIQQGYKALQVEVAKMADATKQTGAALTATTAEQAAVRGAVQDSVKVMSATAEAIQQGHKALQAEVEKMADATRQTIASLTTATAEQAVARIAMQDSTKVMSTTAEAVGQGQKALQAEVEKMIDTTRQTIASLTATVAEQTNGHEVTKRMIGEVANAAMAALALSHGQATGDVPPVQTSTQTPGDVRPPEISPPVPTAENGGPQRLPAAKAITHGEQIRYELGPDRDNLGCWTNAGDWAEWEFDITRPGRFKVAAEIAAVASARFQVVLADRQLDGSAPNTGDYGRFQEVELGIVDVTASGKTRVAVRPVPEGWQPMNLKALDLVPLN